MLGGPFKPDWADDGTLWEAWRRTCTPQSSARRLYSSLRNLSTVQVKNHLATSVVKPGADFSFAKDTSSKHDFCDTPYTHHTQGHFFSDWRSIPALYPVFSPAKARGFLDIKIPSHYYYGSTRRYTYGWDPINLEQRPVDPMEVPWEYKLDKIFWRGATTGGGSHPPGFAPYYQRHRCVQSFLTLTRNFSSLKKFGLDSSVWLQTSQTKRGLLLSRNLDRQVPTMLLLLSLSPSLTKKLWMLPSSRLLLQKATLEVRRRLNGTIVLAIQSHWANTGPTSTSSIWME